MNAIHPVLVLGAGPVGLAAAAHLVSRGIEPLVVEASEAVAGSVRSWGHVRLFSPWKYNIDQAARALLEPLGWSAPDGERYPTGAELISGYLEPLARVPALARGLRLGARVVSVTKAGHDRLSSRTRAEAPYRVRVQTKRGPEEFLGRAVIDATGTYSSPNPLGSDGTLAVGEHEAREQIAHGIPDVLGTERARYAGKRVLVVGSGHSAFNVLLDLAELAKASAGMRLAWALRRPSLERVFGGGDRDQLAERGRLGQVVQSLVQSGVLEVHAGFGTDRIERVQGGLVVRAGERSIGPVDQIVGATGFRPDLAMNREVRLALDPIVESPATLAPLIDPNVHSCGSVPPHGVTELTHPDEGFYLVGMKSYGRAPTFLMMTGYEQVRSVAAALAGDWEAAREVRLVLPETGVCTLDNKERESCCRPEPGGETKEPETSGSASCCGGPREEKEKRPAGKSCCG